MSKRPKILVFTGGYLPGFRGGGPIRSVSNMCRAMSNEADFFVVTRDRDLGAHEPYSVATADWSKDATAKIRYLAPSDQRVAHVAKLIDEIEPDIVYLNSLFDPHFSIVPLIARRIARHRAKNWILAPRGECAPGALGLKSLKKRVFLSAARLIGLYKRVAFQATSAHETADIANLFPRALQHYAPNIGPVANGAAKRSRVASDPLRIVFISRIARMKNPDLAIEAVIRCSTPVSLDIFGPKEDKALWAECEASISRAPPHVDIRYRGELDGPSNQQFLSQYDLFLSPTRGENFGHSIAEALAAGLPVLISSNTPWRGLRDLGLGYDIPLTEGAKGFARRIDEFAKARFAKQLCPNEWQNRVNRLLSVTEAVGKTRDMFKFHQ